MPAGKANPWDTARNWVRARLVYPQNHPQMVRNQLLHQDYYSFKGLDFKSHEQSKNQKGRRPAKGNTVENVILLGGKSKGKAL